jgi:peptidoglycan hydrolase-like protein with peptidoglycan-binding domain
MAEEPVLSPGDSGEWVSYLQQLLEYHRFGSGFTAGTFDDATGRALSLMQEHHSLPRTGVADEISWKTLREAGLAGGEGSSVPRDIAVSMQENMEPPGAEIQLTALDDLPSHVQA